MRSGNHGTGRFGGNHEGNKGPHHRMTQDRAKRSEDKRNQDADDTADAVEDSSSSTSSGFSEQTTAEMFYILEEEKLAGDVYEAFFEQYGANIFDKIGASEDKHFDAVLSQAEASSADTDTFVFEPAGSYVNPEIQALYDELYAYGSTSLQAALEVGVIIEKKDITDLKDAAQAAAGTPLESVYENLLAGSYNHLDAFEGMLA